MPPSIYIALDTTDLARAKGLAETLRPHVGGLKLGLEFYAAHGPAGVDAMTAFGLPIFLDLKLHDIPATVAAAVNAAWRLGVTYMTVHASGGPGMLHAAVAAARERGAETPKLLGVTVLTSLDAGDLASVGQVAVIEEQVLRLAALARDCGLNGVVCSPQEVRLLRSRLGPKLELVVPGVRPAGAALADQKRTLTPAATAKAGATILVIGRPITAAPDPAKAAAEIAAELIAAAPA
ncbi:MAG: orotidine-5'-phosphate decarboxylase [Alphaproteobacteria bacterium]|nr:orotidine-5'-phosphate decarboxylase [Alphaproteobacteria bacterium]